MPWPKLPFPIAACAPKMGSFTGNSAITVNGNWRMVFYQRQRQS
jgi:hypothetical protein